MYLPPHFREERVPVLHEAIELVERLSEGRRGDRVEQALVQDRRLFPEGTEVRLPGVEWDWGLADGRRAGQEDTQNPDRARSKGRHDCLFPLGVQSIDAQ